MSLQAVEVASFSDLGRQRHANEDSFYEGKQVFAVADGMGGARAGEVASQLAVEEFAAARDDAATPEDQLARVARQANRKIYDLAQEDESQAGMGTTLSSIMIKGNDVAIGHVGDSRVYRLRDDQLERLTDDHSLVEQMVREGRLTREQAEVHPQRSIITRALGPEPEVDVETLTYPGRADDVYLLCSDGLTGMVGEDQIASVLRSRSSLDQAGRELVRLANEAGGKDNITVVLVRLGDESDKTVDADTLGGGHQTAVVDAAEVAAAAEAATPAEPAMADHTLAMSAEEAEAARQAAAERDALRRETGEMPTRTQARTRPPGGPERSRARRWVTSTVVLLVIAAAAVGIYVGSRQFYFVGTNDRALVTVYRGLPYELPLGIKLYTADLQTSTPARSICAKRRKKVLNNELRSRGDALDLVKQVQKAKLEC